MHFDSLTLSCVVSELQPVLCPGRVQQVVLVDEHSIGFEIFAGGIRHPLLVSAQPQAPRVQLMSHKLRRGLDQETPLLLLLRKYVRDATLAALEQPDPAERVLHLHFAHKEAGETLLVVECIGRQANVLLLGTGGRILDCLHRNTPSSTRVRLLLPAHPYVPPEAQRGLPAEDDGSPDYYERLAGIVAQPGKLWKALVGGIVGLSPTAAREVAWRAASDAEMEAPGVSVLAVAQALQELWQPVHTGAWAPGLIQDAGRCVAFAAYPLHYRGQFVPTATIGAALESYYAAQDQAEADAYAGQRGQILALIYRARKQLQHRLDALAGDEPAPGEPARIRSSAEWLLALSSRIAPGQSVLEVELGDEMLRIPLDPARSPVEQAQHWFKHAAKLERAAEFIPQRRNQLQRELAFVDQLELDLAFAANQPEIAAVRAELQRSGIASVKPLSRAMKSSTPAVNQPREFRTAEGLLVLVGRNARQNDLVTFKLAHPDDLWLHARGVPGAHVVIRTAGQTVDEVTVHAVAQLAAFYSGARGERAAAVIVARRRLVSRAPGGLLGQVVVERETVLLVPGEWPASIEAPDVDTPARNRR